MKLKSIIVLALLLGSLQTEAQKKTKATKPQITAGDDWETPITKKNKTKVEKNPNATKSSKRRTRN